MFILNSFYLLMPLAIILAFLWAPPAPVLGDSSRILYFHVPLAWVSFLAFVISGIISIIYLRDRENKYTLLEEKACNSSIIGMIFMILAVITGSIWSKLSWGSFWNWDPRQTSIVMLLLIYIAYFSLRTALEENPNRGKLTSAYLIIAMAVAPFFIFLIPRLYHSLHPDTILNPDAKIHLDKKMMITLLVSLLSFTFLYFYLLRITNKISWINNKIREMYERKNYGE